MNKLTANTADLGTKTSVTEQAIDIGALLRTMWLGKWLIGFASCIAILMGGYYAYVMAVPMYRSTAVLIVRSDPQLIDFESVVSGLSGISGDDVELNSQIEVLRSRTLMEKVVRRMDLLKDPEFNGALRPPPLMDQVKTRVKDLIGLGGAQAGPVVQRSPEEIEARQMVSVVNALLGNLTINIVPKTMVFRVTFESEDPFKAAQLADNLADLYILSQIEVKFEATRRATEWLSERAAQLELELEASENRVKDFSAEVDAVNPEILDAMNAQITTRRDQRERAQQKVAEAQAYLLALQSATTPEQKLAVTGDSSLDRLLPRLAEPSAARAFDERFTALVELAELELERNMSQVDALIEATENLEAEFEVRSQNFVELQQLMREAEASRLLYEFFLSRLKETSAQQGIQQADSRVLSNAVIPNAPFAPRNSLILVVSAAFGFIIGLALVLLRESGRSAFRSARELETATGYAILGQIPLMPIRRRSGLLDFLRNKPTSAAAEAIRNMRTSLLLLNVDNPPQVIMSTSSIPGEGKTTQSISLAHNLSGLGKKVLIIEGDIRRPNFVQYFSERSKGTLVEVMEGHTTLEEAVLSHAGAKVDVLMGGKSRVNAADLYASEAFRTMLNSCREAYDYVIIDTPPVLVVPDARVLGHLVDAIMYSVKWDSTDQTMVQEGLRQFSTVGIRVSGLVLSQISPKGMKRYGYGGQYGAYGGYGKAYYEG